MLRALLRPFRRWALLDPKRRSDLLGAAILEGAAAGAREWPRQVERAILRPALLEDERAWADRMCRQAYHAGSCALAIDELPEDVTTESPVAWMTMALRRGRDPGPQGPVTTIVATQRPQRIPVTIISEADHVFVFGLNHPTDRAFVRQILGRYDEPRVRYGFWYWTPELHDGAIECAPLSL
ncbi:MAG: ATP-binding protein [Gemmatimonadales bacterium]|nr:ATP-binding protein [Gemmatimonadales bacterium]